MALSSREAGRVVEASSSKRCLSRLIEDCGMAPCFSVGLDILDAERATVAFEERADSGSSRSAFAWLRLVPALIGVNRSGLARYNEGWFAIESIFLNSAMWAALKRPDLPFACAMRRFFNSSSKLTRFSLAASSALMRSVSLRSSPRILSISFLVSGPSSLSRRNEKAEGVLDGVDWVMPDGTSLDLSPGLMSTNPCRRPDDGAAIVGWTLLGCISDIESLTGVAPEGVVGWGMGEDRATSVDSVCSCCC